MILSALHCPTLLAIFEFAFASMSFAFMSSDYVATERALYFSMETLLRMFLSILVAHLLRTVLTLDHERVKALEVVRMGLDVMRVGASAGTGIAFGGPVLDAICAEICPTISALFWRATEIKTHRAYEVFVALS